MPLRISLVPNQQEAFANGSNVPELWSPSHTLSGGEMVMLLTTSGFDDILPSRSAAGRVARWMGLTLCSHSTHPRTARLENTNGKTFELRR